MSRLRFSCLRISRSRATRNRAILDFMPVGIGRFPSHDQQKGEEANDIGNGDIPSFFYPEDYIAGLGEFVGYGHTG